MRYCILYILALSAVTGCSGPKITAEDVAIAFYQTEAQKACYSAQVIPPYSDARDAALIMMARSISGDPCKTTNVYDARSSIAASQNTAAGQIIGNIASAGIAGVGIVVGGDVLKSAINGAGTSITGDNNIFTEAEGNSTAIGPDLSTKMTITNNQSEAYNRQTNK